MVISFHRLAAKELKQAYKWYFRRSPKTAQRFIEAVDRVVIRIENNPELCPRFRKRYRWIRTHRFPFVLYFEILEGGGIVIMAVAHARRRLGYWNRRRPQD